MKAQPQSELKHAVKIDASQLHTKEEILASVNGQLDTFFTVNIKRAYPISPRYSDLVGSIQNLMHAGGKRNRPYLCVFMYEAYGGDKYEAICQIATAMELLHTAMLVHDDVLDRDLMRYGVDNVSGQYLKLYKKLQPDNPHNALQSSGAAILAGDLLLSSAYGLIGSSNFSHQQRLAVQSKLHDAVFRVIGGEFIETNAGYFEPQETDPLTVALQKTAYYSFVFPLCTGAELAGAPREDIEMLEDFGKNLGIAFQLADDLLGTFGDPATTGKPNDGDIREGRQNYLYKCAYELSDENQKQLLDDYYGKVSTTKGQAEEIRQLFIASGARDALQVKLDFYVKKATWNIPHLNVSIVAKKELRRIADKAAHRDS